ncbi:MAG TPA: 6-pyruvoyl tetrahydropterin synthase family protein [Pirellulales bacterium]|jgi:6-pyruvoyltetrahydropterin/6-carboxytetrahydropterin synthase|nr:6-pyruvoyl tetrahydropterin synthase family protein [Pirellulales bacterium]
MAEQFHVRVSKDFLVFSAAHFITLGENLCERLHGHNYRVAAEVFGPLGKEQWVIDFIALRDTLQEIVKALDHYVLLPTEHAQIRVIANESSVEAVFQNRRWVFPRGDCVLLPLANTTAERLAEYIGRRLLDELQQRYSFQADRLRVEVDECYGQIGVCELSNR